jgi:hypothetical protein
MPGKEKRVATRQAQLRQKKRKHERQPVRSVATSSPTTAEPMEVETSLTEQTASNKQTTTLIDSSAHLSQIRPYVRKELRRISLLSALMFITLASISIFSRV